MINSSTTSVLATSYMSPSRFQTKSTANVSSPTNYTFYSSNTTTFLENMATETANMVIITVTVTPEIVSSPRPTIITPNTAIFGQNSTVPLLFANSTLNSSEIVTTTRQILQSVPAASFVQTNQSQHTSHSTSISMLSSTEPHTSSSNSASTLKTNSVLHSSPTAFNSPVAIIKNTVITTVTILHIITVVNTHIASRKPLRPTSNFEEFNNTSMSSSSRTYDFVSSTTSSLEQVPTSVYSVSLSLQSEYLKPNITLKAVISNRNFSAFNDSVIPIISSSIVSFPNNATPTFSNTTQLVNATYQMRIKNESTYTTISVDPTISSYALSLQSNESTSKSPSLSSMSSVTISSWKTSDTIATKTSLHESGNYEFAQTPSATVLRNKTSTWAPATESVFLQPTPHQAAPIDVVCQVNAKPDYGAIQMRRPGETGRQGTNDVQILPPSSEQGKIVLNILPQMSTYNKSVFHDLPAGLPVFVFRYKFPCNDICYSHESNDGRINFVNRFIKDIQDSLNTEIMETPPGNITVLNIAEWNSGTIVQFAVYPFMDAYDMALMLKKQIVDPLSFLRARSVMAQDVDPRVYGVDLIQPICSEYLVATVPFDDLWIIISVSVGIAVIALIVIIAALYKSVDRFHERETRPDQNQRSNPRLFYDIGDFHSSELDRNCESQECHNQSVCNSMTLNDYFRSIPSVHQNQSFAEELGLTKEDMLILLSIKADDSMYETLN